MAYGIVVIGGQKYIERYQTYNQQVTIASNNQVLGNQRLNLPGVANFWLKGLTRNVVKSNAVVTNGTCPFLFKLGNSDGSIWYNSAGVGGTTDRTLDSLLFGDARFPYPIIPHALYLLNGSIPYEVEDISANAPYTIHFCFQGSLLIPANN